MASIWNHSRFPEKSSKKVTRAIDRVHRHRIEISKSFGFSRRGKKITPRIEIFKVHSGTTTASERKSGGGGVRLSVLRPPPPTTNLRLLAPSPLENRSQHTGLTSLLLNLVPHADALARSFISLRGAADANHRLATVVGIQTRVNRLRATLFFEKIRIKSVTSVHCCSACCERW